MLRPFLGKTVQELRWHCLWSIRLGTATWAIGKIIACVFSTMPNSGKQQEIWYQGVETWNAMLGNSCTFLSIQHQGTSLPVANSTWTTDNSSGAKANRSHIAWTLTYFSQIQLSDNIHKLAFFYLCSVCDMSLLFLKPYHLPEEP